ncbi:serine hydrolase domain-containing protein [Sphingomonas sp. G-3-2-10]|uniref:serine hydrolase domain-containing protein n=1 Tax=Sphingomonas sp. G-3-2-10 TaxID=2728838 RepID=UPI00146A8A08|nr:serine hydrolase domain-containing protein [Sphingomonas sp. G-3-2-10]NML07702.1 beta-lactamase family protein [Sphingomonas sp. G-3-2-10]
MTARRTWVRLALGGAMIAMAAAGGHAALQPVSIVKTNLPATQALADRYVAENKVPGIVMSIGYRDTPTQFVSAGRIAAEADAPMAGPDSLWRVYSMTKPVTGIAAMILIEEGKLKLDQPISDFIPAFKNVRVLDDPNGTTLASHPAKGPITVRHLLTHTAGLGYSIVTKGPLLDEYNKLGLNPAAVGPAMEPQMAAARAPSLEEFANRLATLPLIAEPGTKWSYSVSLDLLGRVIEVASGQKFDQFLKSRLFDPLKMNSTGFVVEAGNAGRLATNYYYMGETRVPVDAGKSSIWLSPPTFPYGGAGLVSSARDYDRFLHMLQNGGTLDGVRILKPETAELAMSNLLLPGTDTTMLGALSGLAGKLGFGAGGSVYLVDVPGAAGKGTFGWAGAAGTLAWVDRGRGIRGTVMVNYMPGEKWPLRADVNQSIHTDFAR